MRPYGLPAEAAAASAGDEAAPGFEAFGKTFLFHRGRQLFVREVGDLNAMEQALNVDPADNRRFRQAVRDKITCECSMRLLVMLVRRHPKFPRLVELVRSKTTIRMMLTLVRPPPFAARERCGSGLRRECVGGTVDVRNHVRDSGLVACRAH